MGRLIIIILGIPILFSVGCAQAVSTYPSYDRAIAKVNHGVVSDAASEPCDVNGAGCDCPAFRQGDHWVYDCSDQYYYWYHGYRHHLGPPYPSPMPGPGGPVRTRRITQE